ncbi:hypothetical protein ILUMI_02117 [Ignelater luminosus]|uniref:Integrase catalytic domain-containing protein n=1 Tax=Ignelater luminosus TaxID=2038154 RepID=A0A8K0DE20_IGNLU|nr:hypothetical protein ILUMI_02117 [Ignelater luminosus]
MKGIARSLIFWPGIDADIEQIARSCNNCAMHAHAPPKFRKHHWEYPKAPWERIHVDYAGPVEGAMLLIIVDAYSKWLEVKTTTSTTAATTIKLMDEVFAAYGVPVTIVSDNGIQFISEDFKNFLRNSGVKYHKLSAPYHPSTNDQAERYVQTVKDVLRDLNEFLRQYRKAPHSTTGLSPARLFLGRDLSTRMDLVRPDDTRVRVTQMDSTYRPLQPGQSVYALSGNPRMDEWIPGTIVTRLGDFHYEIHCSGKKVKRHIDQIRSSGNENTTDSRADPEQSDVLQPPRRVRFHETPAPTNGPARPMTTPRAPAATRATPAAPATPRVPRQQRVPAPCGPYTPQHPRRSNRTRVPPSRFSPN